MVALAELTLLADLTPDSPDETASGQLRTPILIGESKSYDGSGGGVPTDPTGERRNRQFAQHFRSLRSCLSNLSEESGLITVAAKWCIR
jgi:hypothetical protein